MFFAFIFSHVQEFDVAWDCATGNGQAAFELAKKFRRVEATDVSQNQLANAKTAPNIFYSVRAAEKPKFEKSFDLVTVAKAIHWFNIEAFYEEAKRVSKSNGTIAMWGYSLLSIDTRIDPIILDFYTNVIGSYWDKERKLVDEQYRTISFPFEEIETPSFKFSFEWTLAELEGYLTTWSSVQKYVKANQVNPVSNLIRLIQPKWIGDRMKISFPLFVRIGRIK